MNDMISLIWLTHPTALNDAIRASQESPEDAEAALGTLFTALLVDDTFNEYTEAELQAAVAELFKAYDLATIYTAINTSPTMSQITAPIGKN